MGKRRKRKKRTIGERLKVGKTKKRGDKECEKGGIMNNVLDLRSINLLNFLSKHPM